MSLIIVGGIRIRGIGSPYLVGMETHVEARQTDGSWLPLHGVCRAVITMKPDAFVEAVLTFEVAELDLEGVAVFSMNPPPTALGFFADESAVRELDDGR